MFREDNAQYRVDIQTHKQKMKLIGDLKEKIVESLHPSHRKLIFGHMTDGQVLKQIKDRLVPHEDLQKLKIINNYSKIRFTPIKGNIDPLLMEWGRLDIMFKRLNVSNFSDY